MKTTFLSALMLLSDTATFFLVYTVPASSCWWAWFVCLLYSTPQHPVSFDTPREHLCSIVIIVYRRIPWLILCMQTVSKTRSKEWWWRHHHRMTTSNALSVARNNVNLLYWCCVHFDISTPFKTIWFSWVSSIGYDTAGRLLHLNIDRAQ